ncbi:MAG: iron-containing alcohol dehydrogenase, partial [bacterium]
HSNFPNWHSYHRRGDFRLRPLCPLCLITTPLPFAGLALSHARLGVIHGLAHPLGARFHAAHGLVCACCLPAALAFNRSVIQHDLADLKARHGLDVEAHVEAWLDAMKLDNPFAGRPVIDRDAFIRETLASGSTAANPRPVTADDVGALLDTLLGGS